MTVQTFANDLEDDGIVPPPIASRAGRFNALRAAVFDAVQKVNPTAVALTSILAAAGLVAFYLFLINSRYYILASEKGVAYEVDRRTGRTWVLQGSSKRVQADNSSSGRLEVVPAIEIQKMEGFATLDEYSFEGKLYNGSDWLLREITFEITAKNPDGGTRWIRKFRYNTSIMPLSAEHFEIRGAGEKGVATGSWRILELRGYRWSE